MAKLIYGTKEFILFNDLHEVYETIGMLAAHRDAEMRIENNQLSGAWGEEGRILIYSSPEKFLMPISSRFTAGRGNVLYRVNCNDFVLDLISNHGFSPTSITYTGKTASVSPISYSAVFSTIPIQYQPDFVRGYNK